MSHSPTPVPNPEGILCSTCDISVRWQPARLTVDPPFMGAWVHVPVDAVALAASMARHPAKGSLS